MTWPTDKNREGFEAIVNVQNHDVYKSGIKNVVYSIAAQGLSFVLSIVTGLMLPKAMGITQYGYWQVYLFYIGYIMLFSFGFNDGLYLRYGSLDYQQLPFEKLRSAMRVFIALISIVACLLFGLSFLEQSPNKVFAFCTVSLNLLIMGINGTLLTILQFTNRIKLNSILTIANKLLFVTLIIPLLLLRWVDFRLIVAADILTRMLLLAVNIYKSKELFIGKAQNIADGFQEYWKDVQIGVKLMFANVMSSLLVGIGMFIVERFMPIETYGLYSFATTITSFALIFITASSLSLYPLLRRLPENALPNLYKNLNTLLCIGLFLLLAGYYPLYYLIKYQFSNFAGIFDYFYLMFIIVVSQGKMQFLINTYYKVLREEKAMLVANVSGVIVALLAILPAFYFTHSIFSIVAGTTITLIWRCYASEIYLKKKMGIKGYGNIVVELSMMGLFIICVISGKPLMGFVSYMLSVGVYTFLNRKILWHYSGRIFRIAIER